jgi:hypothetical protein
MLSHYRFSDEQVQSGAVGMALAMSCAENGLVPKELAYSLGNSMTQLYSVSVYNKSLYEATYSEARRELGRAPVNEYQEYCRDVISGAPEIINEANRRYASMTSTRQAELLSMSNSLSSMGGNFSSFGQSQLPISTGVHSFQPAENRPNHYLIDFGRGQRICTATASGYVRCM